VEKVLCNKVEKRLFNHSQDLKWEVRAQKKSGEIERIIRKSSWATWIIACSMVFDIVPSILDLTIGAFYFFVQFKGFSLIFATSMVVYTGKSNDEFE
jgi:ABC-type transport system involved in Fe-S cluster assembly fused permease/ATPase subunit